MLHWGQRKLMLAEIELLVALLLRALRLICSRTEPAKVSHRILRERQLCRAAWLCRFETARNLPGLITF